MSETFQSWLAKRGVNHANGDAEAALAQVEHELPDTVLLSLAQEFQLQQARDHEAGERHATLLSRLADGQTAMLSLLQRVGQPSAVIHLPDSLKLESHPLPPLPPAQVNMSVPQQAPPVVNIDLDDLAAVMKAQLLVMKELSDGYRLIAKALEKIGSPVVNVPKGQPAVVKAEAPDLEPLVQKLAEVLQAVINRKPGPMKVETDGKGNVTKLIPQ
jgi:hypothetical protein